MRTRDIVICGQPRSTLFFRIISERAQLKKKVAECKMCVLIFSTTFVWNISHSKKKWAGYDNKICTVLRVNCPLLLSTFNEILNFSTDFRKTLQYQISWISVTWEQSYSMQTDRQTEMMTLIVPFSSFVKAPKSINIRLLGRNLKIRLLLREKSCKKDGWMSDGLILFSTGADN